MQFIRSREGYTLVELFVVVAIMIMMVGVLVSFSQLGQDQTNLYVEASKIIDVVLRSKSLAISAYRDPNFIGRATCGHGLSIDLSGDANTFHLVRYLKGEDPTDEPCSAIGNPSPNPLGARYDRAVAESSTYELAGGIRFDSTLTNVADVVFRPPDPQLYFFGQDGMILPLTSTSSIVIQDNGGRSKIRIVVGPGGQITYNFIQ